MYLINDMCLVITEYLNDKNALKLFKVNKEKYSLLKYYYFNNEYSWSVIQDKINTYKFSKIDYYHNQNNDFNELCKKLSLIKTLKHLLDLRVGQLALLSWTNYLHSQISSNLWEFFN
jgi:hypothetical protein